MRAYIGELAPGDQEILVRYNQLFSTPPGLVACDTETVSLQDRTLLGFAIALPNGDGWYFTPDEPGIPWHLIKPGATVKVWHNAPFDLSRELLGVYGADIDNIEDTAIITRLAGIDTELSVASYYTQTKTESARAMLGRYQVKTMRELPVDAVATKCVHDAQVTMELYLKYQDIVKTEYYQVERQVASMLLHMSYRGLAIDKPYATALAAEIIQLAEFYSQSCKNLGWNPNSPQQVAYMLSTKDVVAHWRRGAKQPTVDKHFLESIPHPYAKLTLLARRHNKLASVVRDWPNCDRVYSHFRMDASTGRISSSDIQLHNLPTGRRAGDIQPKTGPVRRAFSPDNGMFTIFDDSQIELRVLAYLSQDVKMLQAFEKGDRLVNMYLKTGDTWYLDESKKYDIHGTTQAELGIFSRVMAKNFNFGDAYGGSPEILSLYTGIKDLDIIAAYQLKLQLAYPQRAAWIAEQRRLGLLNGYVTTLYGRKLDIMGTDSITMSEKHIANCAVNYQIQGAAAEIFKRQLLQLLHQGIDMSDIALQVHDEVILDGDYKLDREALEHIGPLITPVEIRQSKKWQ